MPDESSLKLRFFALWREKLLLTFALNLVFWSAYSVLGRYHFFPVLSIPLTPLDRWIPFQPDFWTPFYLSIYILTFFVPWLITSRADLKRYALGLIIGTGLCFLAFFFFPTASPRPATFSSTYFYRFVLLLDGPLNAFPSLHAWFLCYTLLLAHTILGSRLSLLDWVFLFLWSAAILYATIATRQHYALDLPAGACLGYISHKLAWRERKAPVEANASTLLSNPSQSHAGSR